MPGFAWEGVRSSTRELGRIEALPVCYSAALKSLACPREERRPVMSKGWKDQRGKERWPEPEPDVIQFFGLIQGPAGSSAKSETGG
jgi:hypothetical protein